jgi:dCMP deaminase
VTIRMVQIPREPGKDRANFDQYYLEVATTVATRADCAKAKVGAVIVKNHKIVSTGYNSPPSGIQGCLTGGEDACFRLRDGIPSGTGSYDMCPTIHAEANAIIRANYEEMQGATLYCTHKPCPGCEKLISGSGISCVIWPTS